MDFLLQHDLTFSTPRDAISRGGKSGGEAERTLEFSIEHATLGPIFRAKQSWQIARGWPVSLARQLLNGCR